MDSKTIGTIVGGIIGVVILVLVVMNIMKTAKCTANGKSAMDNYLDKVENSNSKGDFCNFHKTCRCVLANEGATKTDEERNIFMNNLISKMIERNKKMEEGQDFISLDCNLPNKVCVNLDEQFSSNNKNCNLATMLECVNKKQKQGITDVNKLKECICSN